jgi:hypothetical protein
MTQKYFIEYFYTPSGTTVVEKRLADIAKGAIHCIYDRPSLEAFADYLRKQQDLYVAQNKRCRPVEIKLRFSDGNSLGPGTGLSIGKIFAKISDAEMEILAEPNEDEVAEKAEKAREQVILYRKDRLVEHLRDIVDAVNESAADDPYTRGQRWAFNSVLKEVETDMVSEAEVRPDELFVAAKDLLDEVRKYTIGAGYRTQLLNAAARLKKVLRE